MQAIKKLTALLSLFFIFNKIQAQEYFTINHYDVTIKVNKDASLDIAEKIDVHFTEPRHGIIRKIQFKYAIQPLAPGTEKAERQLESNGYTQTMVDNIKVPGWNYDVSTDGDYKSIKIGSANKYVEGDQQYVITYRILNAINFFKDHSELYFNVIGDQWETTIATVNFKVGLYQPLSAAPVYFVATGAMGARENKTVTKWEGTDIFSGSTTEQLNPNEGVTIGI